VFQLGLTPLCSCLLQKDILKLMIFNTRPDVAVINGRAGYEARRMSDRISKFKGW
jgi:hypothetical protein